MEMIRDDHIVAHMIRTGYPPWVMSKFPDDFDPEEEDSDVYIGNETAEF